MMQTLFISHIRAIESVQELTCLHSKRRLLRAELLWKHFRFIFPLRASLHLLRTAFAVKSRAILDGEDVLYEEGSQRLDRVRHFHPVIHKSEASQCQRAAEVVEVSRHTLARPEFIREQGRVYCEGGGPSASLCCYLQELSFVGLFRATWWQFRDQTIITSYQKEGLYFLI